MVAAANKQPKRSSNIMVPQSQALPAGGGRAEGSENGGGRSPEIDEMVSGIAFLVYNTWNSLWMSVSDLTENVERRFPAVTSALEKHGEIRFVVLDSSFVVNGVQLPIEDRYLKSLVSHLNGIKVSSFSFLPGLTEEEYMWLLDTLCMSSAQIEGDGGFSAVIESEDLEHVIVRNVTLKVVSDDEVVVDEDAAGGSGDGGAGRAIAETKLLAALSDVVCQHTDESVAALQDIAADPEKIADVILQAARIRMDVGDTSEQLSRLAVMVDCLERTFQGLMRHSSFKTKKGKAKVKRTLQTLGKKLHAEVGDDTDVADQIRETIDHMIEGLDTASIAADYARKVKVLEESETRILRFIEEQGLGRVQHGDLEDRLREGGVDGTGWRKLLARSEAGTDGVQGRGWQSDAATAHSVGDLAALLSDLGEQIAGGQFGGTGGPDKLVHDLSEVSEKVALLTEKTEKKIHRFVELVGYDIDDVDERESASRLEGKGPAISRKEMVSMLSEIVMEVYQPLSMIRCSLEMIKAQIVGEVTPGQMDILNVAEQGTDRIGLLIRCLEQISGVAPGSESGNGEIAEGLSATV